MLASLNGNDYHDHTYVFPMQEATDVGEARRFALLLAASLDFSEKCSGRLSIIVNELGNNLVRYAQDGTILLRRAESSIDVIGLDRGPGLDLTQVMRDGFSTGSTPGTGLGAIKRQADEFDIYSNARGTVLYAKIRSDAVENGGLPVSNFQVVAICVPLKGETVSGDSWGWSERETGFSLVAVDGLGHGHKANDAAVQAVAVFKAQAVQQVDHILNCIHAGLKSTRGAAVFAISVVDHLISYAGVGNIRAILCSPLQVKSLISQNGTAGIQIRNPKILTHVWPAGEHLILHSDGINGRWTLSDYAGLHFCHAGVIAGVIFRDYVRTNDDATVVVVRRLT